MMLTTRRDRIVDFSLLVIHQYVHTSLTLGKLQTRLERKWWNQRGEDMLKTCFTYAYFPLDSINWMNN